MSPFANVCRSNQGASTSHISPGDMQLRVHISRESETSSSSSPPPPSRSPPNLPSPPPAAHQSTRQQQQLRDDALTDFFGGRGQRTRAQRTGAQHHVPPPYSPDWDGEKLPQYSLGGSSTSSVQEGEEEPETVARHMFKYGFFFPLFWAVGVYFLYAPLRVSPEWEQDKTEEEKEKMLAHMRRTERMWARRCLWALASFFACIVILVVAVVISKRH
ncbi:hypothetical protein F5I97DRAFT_435019 [Phlebopus sp. FC_14]|nr:hypothetical protein F5I97DRAFT_435019 [Phlebopus sp. FC_14]